MWQNFMLCVYFLNVNWAFSIICIKTKSYCKEHNLPSTSFHSSVHLYQIASRQHESDRYLVIWKKFVHALCCYNKKKHPLIERIVIYAGHVYLFIYHKYLCFSFACPFVKHTCTMHQMDLGLVVCVFFFSVCRYVQFFQCMCIFLVSECDSMCNVFNVCMFNFFSVWR